MAQLSKKNHFVPQFYLKNWQSSLEKIWVYRRLVEHENVPFWSEKNIRGIAYQKHLYTQIKSDEESDNFEKWLNDEYEIPAREAIQKVVKGGRLNPNDWKNIVSFFALQSIRSTKSFLKGMNRWGVIMPEILEKLSKELPKKLEQLTESEIKDMKISRPNIDFPLHISKEVREGEKHGNLKIDTVVGRSFWLSNMKSSLDKSHILHNHRWTIIRPAIGMYWPTSDNPAIMLNYGKEGNYDFESNWGVQGGELLLPLSPEHLLYTKIGDRRPPQRNTRASADITKKIRKFILENSFRLIFSHVEDFEIHNLIPRRVDARRYRNEEEQWSSFHEQHSQAEREIINLNKSQEFSNKK